MVHFMVVICILVFVLLVVFFIDVLLTACVFCLYLLFVLSLRWFDIWNLVVCALATHLLFCG